MENASKALLIAGAILICILIIAIGMYIYNSAQGTIQTAAGQMGQQEKELYNAMIKKYIGTSKKGSDVKLMIEDIISNNNQNVNESGKFISIHVGANSSEAAITGTKGVSGFTTSAALDKACSDANIYENTNGDNNQTNVDAATAEYRELKKKISSGRNYLVEALSKDGIYYAVYVNQIND